VKWHKFEVGFWDSETAQLLKEKLGYRGLFAYLMIISAITRDVHTWEDVQFAHQYGWTKSLRDWARASKSSPRFVGKMLKILHEAGKVSVIPIKCGCANETSESELTSHSLLTHSSLTLHSLLTHSCTHLAKTRLNLSFKNLNEFVHRDALSSSKRFKAIDVGGPSGPSSGRPAGAPRREEKRKHSPLTPQLKSVGSFPESLARQSEFQKLPKEEQVRIFRETKSMEQYRASIASTPPQEGSSDGGKE
jgi:hypothetical protein